VPSHHILFFKSDLFYLLVVGLGVHCCALSQPITHTHTHKHTLSRTPLDEADTCTTHNIHKRQTSIPRAGFEPTVPTNKLPHSCAIDRAATGIGRGQMKCDSTRAETRFRLSPKRTSPFKSARASVQSTTGSRGVCISGSNAGIHHVPR
jgi:hypothetical protein